MTDAKPPVAAVAANLPPRPKSTGYPAVFAVRVEGRVKRPLGDLFGLKNFGVNLTTLKPGAQSALRHSHAKQDEFVYILEGEPTLRTDEGETLLSPGMCAGFRAGTGNAHHLVNRTSSDVVYIEIGDRMPGETAAYPDDDLKLITVDGQFRYLHKDGTPY
jgi:uncharacterized cupin superfamily protein